jgi:hypothetical protein
MQTNFRIKRASTLSAVPRRSGSVIRPGWTRNRSASCYNAESIELELGNRLVMVLTN